ncbi:MAG TPA: hypothetical protein EYN66_12500 [Myxococcales bacterium]|nr:hypothetical protein [Myxococcales bacterium]
MSPTGEYDHEDRIGVRIRCSICGAFGVNRATCPKTTPEAHAELKRPMKSYRGQAHAPDRDSRTEPIYDREWQSINNGDDLTLTLNPEAIIGNTVHDLTLRIRVKIKVEFE